MSGSDVWMMEGRPAVRAWEVAAAALFSLLRNPQTRQERPAVSTNSPLAKACWCHRHCWAANTAATPSNAPTRTRYLRPPIHTGRRPATRHVGALAQGICGPLHCAHGLIVCYRAVTVVSHSPCATARPVPVGPRLAPWAAGVQPVILGSFPAAHDDIAPLCPPRTP